MKNMHIRSMALLLAAMFLLSCAGGQAAIRQDAPFDPGAPMPVNPRLKLGTLDNGLTYYVMKNTEPAGRLQIVMVVNAGTVLEDDDQRGAAHLVEHLAFNGTEHYPGRQIMDYMESMGEALCGGTNAGTSFDETVYSFEITTGDPEVLDTTFSMISDIATGISFEPEEVEKERGVLIEEWRSRSGVGMRMRDKILPELLKGSRYAERLTTSERPPVEGLTRDALMRFYRDWYRPDLMAVIAVGDADEGQVEALIRKYFSGMKMPENARERVHYEVPERKDLAYLTFIDREFPVSSLSLMQQFEQNDEGQSEDYRRMLARSFAIGFLNARLAERTQDADPPFLGATANTGGLVRGHGVFSISVVSADNKTARALEEAFLEVKRARQYGFTRSEFDRMKAEIEKGLKLAFEKKDETHSCSYAGEFKRNFLTGEPIPGADYELKLVDYILSHLTLEDVNTAVREMTSSETRIILATAPEKEGVGVLSQDEVLATLKGVESMSVLPYEDNVREGELVTDLREPGTVTAEQEFEAGRPYRQWTLSNGATVVLMPTDLKKKDVVFSAYSKGGTSLYSDEDYVPAETADSIVAQGGLGDFDVTELGKKLSGKTASISPYIGELSEGLSGSASTDDLETMFQLAYLYFTAPRKDPTAFENYRHNSELSIEKSLESPYFEYTRTVSKVMYHDHYRRRPWDEDMVKEMDLDRSLQIYRERFADASDFTFFLVGDFDLDTVRPLVEKYLASLPATHAEETWKDIGVPHPEGIIERTVQAGRDKSSEVTLHFMGPYQWDHERNFVLDAMADVLQLRLNDALREDLSGTYSVGVDASIDRFPKPRYDITVGFNCDPGRVDDLTAEVFSQIARFKGEGDLGEDIAKIKETRRRTHEKGVESNWFWLGKLKFMYGNQIGPEQLKDFETLLSGVTQESVREAAVDYLNTKNYVKFVLEPEESDAADEAQTGADAGVPDLK